jgi:hypothetical protein
LPLAHPEVKWETLALVSKTAEDCYNVHGVCSKSFCPTTSVDGLAEPPFLPRRVIDVGDGDAKLVSSVYLHESTPGERARYVTLSHRWGKRIDQRTTRQNVMSRRNGIATELLPKSFQDAVTVTRKLGVRYLWIDAICIIQNDRSDWIKQAPLMGKIYRNAYCTIAVHSAKNSTIGFLKSHPSHYMVRVGSCQAKNGVRGTLHIGVSRCFEQAIDQSFIKRRAWVLQELTLSRRTVHFSNGQIYWDCPHRDSPRQLGFTTDVSAPTSQAWRVFDTDADVKESWYDLVSDYSKCELTYPNDKLAAISGIALEYPNQRNEEYHSGLFESSLPQGLLWFSREGSLERRDRRAPSWSWASVDGPLQFMNTQHASADAEITAIRHTQSVNNAMKATSSNCTLVLLAAARGSLVAGLAAGTVEFGALGQSFLRRNGASILGIQLYGDDRLSIGQLAFDDGKLERQKHVLCARLCTTRLSFDEVHREMYMVLVLEHSDHLGHYRRVGVGVIHKLGWFDGCSPQRIEIV